MRPGPRDHLITRRIAAAIAKIDATLLDRELLDGAEGPRRLSRHLATVIERALAAIGDDRASAETQAAIVNALLHRGVLPDDASEEELILPPTVWTGLRRAPEGLARGSTPLVLPATPLSTSDLLVNGVGQPNIGSELSAELESADSVDLICAFVIWSGVVRLRDALAGVVARGGRVRVITTTYMGATQRRAVDELVQLGAAVRVAFDARTTKLHAKAWLLERDSGLSTAFVGSSNLSHTALFDGLEWNVRLSAVDATHLIDRVRSTFESCWASDHFEAYDPMRDADRLDRALGAQASRETTISFAGLDVHPYPHQERMLDRLVMERTRHDRHHNLVVAATGTGKTVVAALDYRRLRREAGRDLSLLFVAHRERILDQSRTTFRHVLRDGTFGEIHGGGRVGSGRHVFAMIQSLRPDSIDQLAPEAFDVVIVDEFHHAAAQSYRRLLDRLRPLELLGLTATPERMDEQDVTHWFGGRFAVEMRLWEAIDEGFLVPFQYFGVADGTDLSSLEWRRGGYALEALDKVLTGDDLRVQKLLEAIRRVIADPGRMRALGFCVSVEHAHYMARKFSEAGLPSVAVSGMTAETDRTDVLACLERGELRTVFSVDVLGEGVDVPAVDTVLLLRPTDSAMLFTQQLGRGLRRADGKAYLTVLDLIGQQHRSFRFDRRLQAIVDPRRGPLVRQVAQGFPFLPSGCHLELDRQSREIVLDNLRAAARLAQWRRLVEDLRALGDVDLPAFLDRTEREPVDLYRRRDQSWTRLRREAGLTTPPSGPAAEESELLRALARLLHVDDPERVSFYRRVLAAADPPDLSALGERERRLMLMLHFDLWGGRREFPDLASALAVLWPHENVRAELHDLLGVLDARSQTLARQSTLDPRVPLWTHASYSRDEILGAYGLGDAAGPRQLREGVLHVPAAATDVFFVTFHKAERDYSPTTMYRDYAVSRELFHWESQATQSDASPSILRYRDHHARGGTVVLCVRERKRLETGVAAPYVFLGPARYVTSSGSRPVSFTWQLLAPMPEELFEMARSVAAA